MNYETKQNIKGWASTLLVVGAIAVCARGCMYISREENETQKLIDRVYVIAAGEDRVLDKEEKSRLMYELHIPGVLDENERLEFENLGSRAYVYAAAGAWRPLRQIPRTELEGYIARHATNRMTLEERK